MSFSEYLNARTFEDRFSTVLRVARKSNGKPIDAICESLQIPSKTYQIWESGKDFPNLYQWKSICDFFDISIDSCRHGVIDHHRDVKVTHGPQVGTFTIPPHYAGNQAASIRWYSPIIEFLRFRLGEKSYNKFCETSLKMDSDYFYLYDCQANFNLTQDLFRELIKLKISEEEFQNIAKTGIQHLYPQTLDSLYGTYKIPDFIFLNLDYLNSKFDLNFKYELIEDSNDAFFIAVTSADWLKDNFKLEPKILQWHHLYKREWFKHAVEYISKQPIEVREIELDDKGDIECLFQVQMA